MPDDRVGIRANYSPLDIRDLHEILGRETDIALPVLNGETWHNADPAVSAILDQVKEAVATRDAALASYRKAKPIAQRASTIADNHYQAVKAANRRALALRETLEMLKKVPRAK